MKIVKEIMRTFPYSCKKDENLQFIASWMAITTAQILSVTDENNRVIGTISYNDVCAAIRQNNLSDKEIKVSDIMNPNAVSINVYEDEAMALKTMRSNRLGYLNVVDEHAQIKGVVSFMVVARRIIQLKNELSNLGCERSRVNGLGLSSRKGF